MADCEHAEAGMCGFCAMALKARVDSLRKRVKELEAMVDWPRCQLCGMLTDSGPGDLRCDCPKEKPEQEPCPECGQNIKDPFSHDCPKEPAQEPLRSGLMAEKL